MPAIEIDDFTHGFITAEIAASGESESAYLRRRLVGARDSRTGGPTTPQARASSLPERDRRLRDHFADPHLLSLPDDVDRYLAILSRAYAIEPEAFAAVCSIAGRKRVYFTTDVTEIEANKEANPKRIPDTPYWTETRFDTNSKCKLLKKVLVALRYQTATARSAVSVVSRGAG